MYDTLQWSVMKTVAESRRLIEESRRRLLTVEDTRGEMLQFAQACSTALGHWKRQQANLAKPSRSGYSR
jgi:hypothetical protein